MSLDSCISTVRSMKTSNMLSLSSLRWRSMWCQMICLESSQKNALSWSITRNSANCWNLKMMSSGRCHKNLKRSMTTIRMSLTRRLDMRWMSGLVWSIGMQESLRSTNSFALSVVSISVTQILILNAQRTIPRASLTQQWVDALSSNSFKMILLSKCYSLQMKNLLKRLLVNAVTSSGVPLLKVTRPILSVLPPLNNLRKRSFFKIP